MKTSDPNVTWLRDWPIREKLMFVIMLTCGVVLLLACGLLGSYQIYKFRESLVRETTVMADVLAKNTQAALAFEDENAAEQTLQALQADSYVRCACLYDAKQARFAVYPRGAKLELFPETPPPDGHHFTYGSLVVLRPVILNGRRIGTIYLQTNLAGLYDRLRLLALFAVGVLAVSGLAAFVLSTYLQRPISRPIHALTETARRISADRDFATRLQPHGRDEVGQLTDALNQLLLSIEERDKALRMTNDLLRGEITERQRAEDALREVHAQLADRATHLEAMVEQRTAKLRETVGELEAFSYSIAHDMRAPLRSLQGFSDILLNEHAVKLDAEGQGFLQRIAKSATRMDKLIQDVLNYSRVVRSESPLEPVDVAELLREIMDTYPMFATEHADIAIEEPIPAVLGNEAMLTQIFSNLIGNAIKFVPAGTKPRIRIWAEPKGDEVRLCVQDNGIGIEPDQRERIFVMFQQVSKKFEGTGIGLAIVKKAVERMGGRVGVSSEIDRGSTFWIEMQRAEDTLEKT